MSICMHDRRLRQIIQPPVSRARSPNTVSQVDTLSASAVVEKQHTDAEPPGPSITPPSSPRPQPAEQATKVSSPISPPPAPHVKEARAVPTTPTAAGEGNTGAEAPYCGATLVVCPLVAVIQWRQEIARFTAPGSVKVSSLASRC